MTPTVPDCCADLERKARNPFGREKSSEGTGRMADDGAKRRHGVGFVQSSPTERDWGGFLGFLERLVGIVVSAAVLKSEILYGRPGNTLIGLQGQPITGLNLLISATKYFMDSC
ncbi:hypothetical protein EYZ11_000779 [Aspergillus tanneri]|uniref:Uncharacterized protein n=1 Tax=Aspergillus tanneri TaxID=1220188 RepID=A0A4S3JW80_9EURO|nr:hypothetical protein EYZ11_000779 [Aspergillus tanneri]